jgi:hypothetical protein
MIVSVVVKPETMCEEAGCTRPWTREIAFASLPVNAPTCRTTKKVCGPCADAHERNTEAD